MDCQNKKLSFFLALFFLLPLSQGVQSATDEWVNKALKLQREIDLDAPLNEATIIGTHNSYNSKAYQKSLSRYMDPNQDLTITQQLNEGVRSIELDAHWAYSTNLRKKILLCHGRSNHIGCGVFDRTFTAALQELKKWLINNPNEVVLVYIERFLDGHESQLIKELTENVGEYIFTPMQIAAPQDITCMPLPTHLTKRSILATGKQLVIVTKGCEINKDPFIIPWQRFIFTGMGNIPKTPYTFLDEKITAFQSYPDCGRTKLFYRDPDHTSMWRIFEDRTRLADSLHHEKKMLAADIVNLTRCGINWPTMDWLLLDDARMRAAIWSWKPNYPKANQGDCAIYRINEGYENTNCTDKLQAYVCQLEKSPKVELATILGDASQGETNCQLAFGAKWHFVVPVNGKRLAEVKERMQILGLQTVWLNYKYVVGKGWIANS